MAQTVRELNLEDVQRIVVQGFPKRVFSRWTLFRITNAQRAKDWLRSILPCIGRGHTRGRQSEDSPRLFAVAFTLSGMDVLGLPAEETRGFSGAFRQGMCERWKILGDDAGHAQWRWGTDDAQLHMLVVCYANTAQDLDFEQTDNGLTNIYTVDAKLREDGTDNFGFRDGISQPFIDGVETSASNTLGSQYNNRVKAGEFILGYPNEGAHFGDSPSVPEDRDQEDHLLPDDMTSGRRSLGLNGSYLVLRQLSQNVDLFNQLVTENEGDDQLKAKLIGRWPSGAPLVLAPQTDNLDLAQANDFAYYSTDRWGYRCPLGAHVRRANPRDALVALDRGRGPKQAAQLANAHRIIRRGRSYQYTNSGGKVEHGLMFACINASIEQQFEFVQQSWINEPNFAGLQNEDDPVVGPRQHQNPCSYTIHTPGANRTINGLQAFVTVRGGAYFFLPSIKGISFLIDLPDA